MSKKTESEAEFLARLESSLAQDPLRADMPIEEVRTQLREMGADPSAINKRGADAAARLLAARRLSWMGAARAKRETMARVVGGMKSLPRRPRMEEMAMIDAVRAAPGLRGAVETAFRKRKPESLSDDEVHELLEEIEALRLLTEKKDDEGGGEEGP